ncbi:MAG TPA: ROK family protein [Pyrinomonadaceae bacterium]|nr:ROK family protein [Pyrinomonadaceae bacterium]
MPASPNKFFAGIDVSRSAMRAAVVAADSTVVTKRESAYQPDSFANDLAALVSSLREAGEIERVGLAIPGLVNRETDRVLVSTGLPSFVRADLHDELMKATGSHLELENDANAAAYAEYKLGAARDVQDFFYIHIGDSVGGAFILDGKLWTGVSGCAGEVGHTTINPDGNQCECGNIGCLETVASGPNIARRARERLNRDSTSSLSRLATTDDFTAQDLAREATNGDDFSIMMIERTGRYIGTAVAGIINLLSPARIVLGGAVVEAGDLILNSIIAEAKKRSFQACFDSTRIISAALGVDGVAVGAALLARDS